VASKTLAPVDGVILISPPFKNEELVGFT